MGLLRRTAAAIVRHLSSWESHLRYVCERESARDTESARAQERERERQTEREREREKEREREREREKERERERDQAVADDSI